MATGFHPESIANLQAGTAIGRTGRLRQARLSCQLVCSAEY
jgi:hypothetical protein